MGPDAMVWVVTAFAAVALGARLRRSLARARDARGSSTAAVAAAASVFPTTSPSDVACPGDLKRQVFISHTGQDGGAKTFAASILRPALEAAGLEVYMDFVSLKPGGKWKEELVDAAANSMVVVVVLSKTYTKRFWCMLELDLALHSHHQLQEGGEGGGSHSEPLVIPVFYDSPNEIVDEASIQKQWSTGKLEARLREVEELGPQWVAKVMDVGSRWAANITAMKGELQNVRRKAGKEAEKDEELQLARRVVKAAVRHIPSLVDVGVEVVGLEEQEAALAAELGGPERLGVWLYGQGGLGKSTMARLLFNRLASSFPHRAFISIAQDDGPAQVEGHVTKAVEHLGGVRGSTLHGFVRDNKVLLVLDNVWTASQLNALLPTTWGEGSTVIITSRLESLVGSDAWRKVHKRLHHHEMAGLAAAAARQLFRRAAGLEGGLPASLWDLEEAILKTCGGLPLALQLLGGQLYEDTQVASWRGALAALHQGVAGDDSEGRLKGVLLHSLVGLSSGEVHMFLDAATILRGMPLSEAMAVWTAWHGAAAPAFFKELSRRCLLRVEAEGWLVKDDMLVVHDVLVVLGQGVVLSETPGFEGHWGSRVWVEGGKVVGRQQGQKVLAVNLGYRQDEWQRINTELASSPDLSGVRVLLGMEGACPAHGLSTLRVLEILSFPGAALPEAFTQLTALRSLTLTWCASLAALPGAFGQLAALQELEIQYCQQLIGLPESFGQLAALQALNLTECTQLAALPGTFGRLAALQTLNLKGCRSLAALPDLRVGLGALRALNIEKCTSLMAVPSFDDHPRLHLTCDATHLAAVMGTRRAWFGVPQGWRAIVAAAPAGCWVSQWRIWSDCGVTSLQGVLNDDTLLPILETSAYREAGEETVVGAKGGCFTEVHGRSDQWGLAAIMGCGRTENAASVGEAWTFQCPPGHRVVGYAGSAARDHVEGVCFLTAEFQEQAGC